MNYLKLIFSILVFGIPFQLFSFEPDFSLGTSLFYEDGSEEIDPDFFTGINADGFQRNTYSDGYYSWFAGADYRYNIADSSEYEDFERLALDIHHETGSIAFEASAAASLSLNSIEYGIYARPDWKTAVLFVPDSSDFSARLDYKGSFVFQDTGSDDRFINSLQIKGSYDPSLRLGISAAVEGGLENYSELYKLNSSGSDTGTERNDKYILLQIDFEGLAGYFSFWEISGRIKMNDSNANRWIDVSGLEDNSEDYTSLRIDAEFSWSPVAALELTGEGYCEYFMYSERKELDSSGSLTGSDLTVTETGWLAEAGWTFDNKLFWIFSVSVFKSFSGDQAFDEWSSSIGGRIKYSF